MYYIIDGWLWKGLFGAISFLYDCMIIWWPYCINASLFKQMFWGGDASGRRSYSQIKIYTSFHLKINTTPSRPTYFQAYLSAFECTPSPGGRSHSGYPSFSQPNFQFIGPSGSRFEGICRSRLAFQCGKRFGWLCRRSQISCFRYLPFLLF